MKITVFGAGAVGGHVAARLGAGAASGRHRGRGGRPRRPARRDPRARPDPVDRRRALRRAHPRHRPAGKLGVQDVVFVALKSSTLPQAAPAIAPLLGPETSVVFAMNGIPWWYLYRCPENGLPRPDLSRLDPGGVLGAHDRARARHRLHDQFGQHGGRARGHPQFARAPATVSPWASPTARCRGGSRRSRQRSSAPASAPRSAPRSATRSGRNCCATSAPARSAR